MTETRDGEGRRGTARVREALSTLVDLSGLSRREIERRLAGQGCGMDVGRVLSGRFELKMHQVLALIAVLAVHPVELFRLVFREPEQRSPILVMMASLLGAVSDRPPAERPQRRPATEVLEELSQRLAAMMRDFEKLRAMYRPTAPAEQRSSRHVAGDRPR